MFKKIALATVIATAATSAAADLQQMQQDAYAAFWAEQVAATCVGFGLVDEATMDMRSTASDVMFETGAAYLGDNLINEIYHDAFEAAQEVVAGGDADLFNAACAYVA